MRYQKAGSHTVDVNRGAVSISTSGAFGFQLIVRIPGAYVGVDLTAEQLSEISSAADEFLPEEKKTGR